jgi:hypothetical protein
VEDVVSYAEYTVDELIEAATELNDRADALFGRLARIERTARGDGIAATVNLEGRLVDLTLSAQAVALPPEELAAEIFHLTQEASGAALADGLDALAPVAGEELAAELRALIDARPQAGGPPDEPASRSATGPGIPPPAGPAAGPIGERASTAPAGTSTGEARARTLDDTEDFSEFQTWAAPS